MNWNKFVISNLQKRSAKANSKENAKGEEMLKLEVEELCREELKKLNSWSWRAKKYEEILYKLE